MVKPAVLRWVVRAQRHVLFYAKAGCLKVLNA